MTIAQAFNEIAAAQGGTPNNSGTIAGAIDALNDTLAGSDQEAAATIEEAVRLLGAHISSGGGGATKHSITYSDSSTRTDPVEPCLSDAGVYSEDDYVWYGTGAAVSEAYPGAVLGAPSDAEYGIAEVSNGEGQIYIWNISFFVMPDADVVVYIS